MHKCLPCFVLVQFVGPVFLLTIDLQFSNAQLSELLLHCSLSVCTCLGMHDKLSWLIVLHLVDLVLIMCQVTMACILMEYSSTCSTSSVGFPVFSYL